MDAYNTAVLSYALATAAGKYKPSLLGLPPNISNLPYNLGSKVDEVSLTPPTKQPHEISEEIKSKTSFYQLLCNLQDHLIGRKPIHFQHLLKMCSMQQSDVQTIALLGTLQNELHNFCKQNTGTPHVLLIEGDNKKPQKTEAMCNILLELCVKYGLADGANFLKTYLSYHRS